MYRRITIALGALAVAALGAGCTTFSDNDAVARVGDHQLSRSDLESLVNGDDASESTTPGSTPDPVAADDATDTLTGDDARQWIGLWVQDQLLKSVLADSDGEVTDANRQQERQALEQQQGFTGLPATQQDLYVELNATANVVGRLNFDADEHRESYEAGMQESGVACLGAIILDSRADANDALADIEAGSEFAEVARERSTNPQLAQAGGSLGCATTDQLRQQLPAPLLQAAGDTPVGDVSDPVQLPGGAGAPAQWVVLTHLPFDEVQEDLAQLLGQDAATRLVQRKANDADIYVDPRYGSFDVDAGVTALGGTATPDPALGGPSGS